MAGGLLGEGAGVAPVSFNGEDEEQEPNVSPEEQSAYDMFVRNGMEMLYTKDGKVQPQVAQRLKEGDDPIESLARTAVWTTMMLENSAKNNGGAISDEVLYHGGQELLEQLAEVAEAFGFHTYEDDELEGSWYRALDLWREANTGEGGRFNPEEASSDFMQLASADNEGTADELLPGFSRIANRQAAKVQSAANAEGEE